MECNRDEALRAKDIAERKFLTKDISGAKKFALKAQTLYPDLEGISQMLATLDIYLAAENKINGESDFYGILGVSPLADDKTVRAHYRNLALSLHPDKNKSIGADGAFKHISEAWSLLSDKARRKAYDQKRNTKVNGWQNGFYNFTRSTSTTPQAKDTTPKSTQTNSKTFWTVCHGCKMQYEYLRMYLHQNLLCPNCHEPFLAMETPAPNTKVSTKGFKSSKTKNNQQRQRKGENAGDPSNYTTYQWGPFSKTTAPSSSQAATMVQRAYERVKREREEAQAAIKALNRKKKRSGNLSSSGHLSGVDVRTAESSDIRSQLVHKAKTEIKRRLSQWKSETVVNHKVDREEEQKEDLVKKKTTTEPLTMDVPHPDFHNFDRERSEGYFREGDIWAAYDDDDGMPRNYAFIHKVKSMDPFKIKVCWLNSRTDNEMDVGFPLKAAFGEFKIGKHENLCVSNYFSHKVNYKKLENGGFEVYPRIGEVWGLYRHWSPEWNEETPRELKRKYEIVQVDDCDDGGGGGFRVTQLVKVAGFKTVFHRQINVKESRVIPESEILRFSHQIPSYLLTGKECLNAPKGCRELDPAATPDEFLQVIAVVQEEENIDDDDDDESAAVWRMLRKEVVNLDDD